MQYDTYNNELTVLIGDTYVKKYSTSKCHI